MSAAQHACRLLNTLEYKRRQREPAPKGFGEILGAAQNIVKDSQVQQSASWRPTEIQLQDEDYIHKQLVAPEAASPRRVKGVRLAKGLRLASRVIRQPSRKVRWGDGSSGGQGSPTGAASRKPSYTSSGGASSYDSSGPLKQSPAIGNRSAAAAPAAGGGGGGDDRWDVEGVSIERGVPSSATSSAAAAAGDASTSGRDVSQMPGIRLPQIHPGKASVGFAPNSRGSSPEPQGVRTSFEKQQQQQQQQRQLSASLRPQGGSPPPAAALTGDSSSNRGSSVAGHIRSAGEGGSGGRASPVAAGGNHKAAPSAAGLNGDLMALYLAQPECSSSSLHAGSDAGSQQGSRSGSAITDKADQQLQRLRQAATARKEADSSEEDDGEDPWTQELGYKPLSIPDSMFLKWTEASHHKPAASAAATANAAGPGSSGDSSRGPSARRASVATYIPGGSLQPAAGGRGAAAGGGAAGWSSNGHARRASIGTVYPMDDASLAGKLSSIGSAAAPGGGGTGLPRHPSLTWDTPQLVPAAASGSGPQRTHSGLPPSLPSLGSKAGMLAASLRSGASNATSSSTTTSSTTKAAAAARIASVTPGHRL